MSVLYGFASAAEDRAETLQRKAEREAAAARAVTDFLVEDMLESGTPEVAKGQVLSVQEVLENASNRVGDAFPDQPEVEAEVRETLGRAYLSLGFNREAVSHLEFATQLFAESLGVESPEALRSTMTWARAMFGAGDLDAAIVRITDALESSRKTLGDDADLTLSLLATLASMHYSLAEFDEASAEAREHLDRAEARFGANDRRTVAARRHWRIYSDRDPNRSPFVENLLEDAITDAVRELGATHPQTLQMKASLGSVLTHQRRFEDAEPLLEGAYHGLRSVLGDTHPGLIVPARDYAELLKEEGRLDEALAIARALDPVVVERRGRLHPQTMDVKQSLAAILLRSDCDADALEVIEEALKTCRALYGESHLWTGPARSVAARAQIRLGRLAEAEANLSKAIQVFRENNINSGTELMWALRQLVFVLGAQGREAEAHPFSEELIRLRREDAASPGADAWQLTSLARDLLDAQPKALINPEEALKAALKGQNLSSETYHYNRYVVARAYRANGLIDESIHAISQALAAIPLEHSSERGEYELFLVDLYLEEGNSEAAEQVYRRSLSERRQTLGEFHEDVAHSLFDLGRLMRRLGRPSEAEEMLHECLRIRMSRSVDESTNHCPRTRSCELARVCIELMELASESGQSEEARAYWQRAHSFLDHGMYCSTDLASRLINEIKNP